MIGCNAKKSLCLPKQLQSAHNLAYDLNEFIATYIFMRAWGVCNLERTGSVLELETQLSEIYPQKYIRGVRDPYFKAGITDFE